MKGGFASKKKGSRGVGQQMPGLGERDEQFHGERESRKQAPGVKQTTPRWALSSHKE